MEKYSRPAALELIRKGPETQGSASPFPLCLTRARASFSRDRSSFICSSPTTTAVLASTLTAASSP